MTSVEDLIAQRPGMDALKPADQTEATKINDFIYASSGTSNAYMLLTDAGRVLLNTGMGFEALTHKKLFDAIRSGPTPYIITTQAHVDHVGGVHHFREPETVYIAQALNRACQRDDERIAQIRTSQAYIWFSQVFDQAAQIAVERPDVFRQDRPVPDITFDHRHDLEVGGLQLELHHVPGGETVDSTVVWLPQHRILFSGNTFGPLFPHFPNINTIRGDKYRFMEPYMEAVKTVMAFEPEMLITGHFEPIVGRELIQASLQRLHDAAEYVHSETLKGMNDGIDIFTLMRTVTLPERLTVGQGYGKVSWAVRTIWESYMGWFKAQATSELYPTQPADIYPELVELAGAGAVIDRGREKLAADDVEAAVLLSEVALKSQDHSRHRDALVLALDAHLALQRRSVGNFWEDGWVNNQIKVLRAKLDEG